MSMNPFSSKPSTAPIADEEFSKSPFNVEMKPDTNIVSDDSSEERPNNDGLANESEVADIPEPLTCENATHFKAPNGRVFAATEVLRRIAISDRKLQPCDAPQVAEDSE